MASETIALLTSFKAIYDIANAMLGIRDSVKFNEKIMELQSAIIAAQNDAMAVQQSSSALETKNRELEAECVRLKDWSAEKQEYEIREIADGVFAYVNKSIVDDFEHTHKLCCKCFTDGQKSLLQQSKEVHRTLGLTCPRCKFIMIFEGYRQPSNMTTSVKRVIT